MKQKVDSDIALSYQLSAISYQLLCYWVQQSKVTREQATRIIWSTLIENWFDITQTQ